MWSLSLITAPAAEPLDVETDVRPHLRLTADEAAAQMSLLLGAIEGARQECETFTQRQLITTTWELWLESWMEPGIYDCESGGLRLPLPPLQSLTDIKYIDLSGAEQTLSSSLYTLSKPAGPQAGRAIVFPAYGAVWPSVLCRPAAIKVKFVAGYGASAAAVPARLKQGMLLCVGEAYERREFVTPGHILPSNPVSAERCFWPFRAF